LIRAAQDAVQCLIDRPIAPHCNDDVIAIGSRLARQLSRVPGTFRQAEAVVQVGLVQGLLDFGGLFTGCAFARVRVQDDFVSTHRCLSTTIRFFLAIQPQLTIASIPIHQVTRRKHQPGGRCHPEDRPAQPHQP